MDPKTRRLVKSGRPFTFELLVPAGSDIDAKVARYIKLCLIQIGVEVKLTVLPFAQLGKRYYRNTDFEAVLTEMIGANKRFPEIVYNEWVTTPQGKSWAGGFESPEVTRLIRSAIAARYFAQQKDLFFQVDALLAQLQPGSFLFQKSALDAMSKRFALAYPFAIDNKGIHRLQHIRLTKPLEHVQ